MVGDEQKFANNLVATRPAGILIIFRFMPPNPVYPIEMAGKQRRGLSGEFFLASNENRSSI